MLSLKHVTKHRSLFSSILNLSKNSNFYFYFSSSFSSLSACALPTTQTTVTDCFKTWFTVHRATTDPPLLRHIYQILSSGEDFSTALSSLSLPLSEQFVLSVLRYGGEDYRNVLSCLRFFDWAGHQPGFYHTRATFIAIFRILSRANHMPVILDYLKGIRGCVLRHRVRFYDTLVIGYAIAGKPNIALQVFGKMRFLGLDLDCYTFHILLNALIDDNYFNTFDVIVSQIRMRGYETHVTNFMVVKRLCRQGRLEEAEAYIHELVCRGKELRGSELSTLVEAFCQSNRFGRAVELVRQFGSSGLVPLDNAYGVWIKHLVQSGRLSEALEFFWHKKNSEGYAPGPVRYNILICRLLRENRLLDVYDLLMDMNETCIPPDVVTMNAVMCFFCKAGMADVALELFNSRSQFGLPLNHMAYKYLILTLCWDGSLKEAFSVFRCAVDEGYFPDRPTFSTLADALCRGCKIDEMKEVLHLALARGFLPDASTYGRFISALCRTGRIEDGYLIHGDLNDFTARGSYVKMIRGFIESNRSDIAARLLVEMKGKGHQLSRSLFRAVLLSLLDKDASVAQFFNLLERLANQEPYAKIYNHFIEGAGYARKVELAREVYELMQRNRIMPSLSSHILMLMSYLCCGRISDALNFFRNLQCQNVENRKLYNSLIVGLCKNKRADIARKFFFEMLNFGMNPSTACYESLVQQLCSLKRYDEAIKLVNLYEKTRHQFTYYIGNEKPRHQLTSYMGNVLLFHSLFSPEVFDVCVHLRGVREEESSGSSLLTLVIGAFSGRLRVKYGAKELEEIIAKCFPLDLYTYNLLLRQVIRSDMDEACDLFDRISEKGYEPNHWTYDIMIHGFLKHGRKDEAEQWKKNLRGGF